MCAQQRQGARKPATKFPNLRKRLEKAKLKTPRDLPPRKK
jgi:hypothetical protein